MYSNGEGLAINLFNAHDWYGPPPGSVDSNILSGDKALLNDRPIWEMVQTLAGACMRNFCSAPNGDFMAWFPDHFGQYGTAGKMIVRDIEIQMFPGLSISWDDRNLRTHQFVSGGEIGSAQMGPALGSAVGSYRKFATNGVVSVEQPEVMAALFNLPADSPWKDTKALLARFGARPQHTESGAISGDMAEFWLALHLFQANWAKQFSTSFKTTFMPEVYPGMLLVLEEHGLQVYVTEVTHTFDFEAGGFNSDISVMAPAATDGSGMAGLPLAGPIPDVSAIQPPTATDGWNERMREGGPR
jgi:hypothetical protein